MYLIFGDSYCDYDENPDYVRIHELVEKLKGDGIKRIWSSELLKLKRLKQNQKNCFPSFNLIAPRS